MFWFRIILYTGVMVPYSVYYIKKYKVSPVSVFLLMQMSFFYGICFAPRGTIPEAQKLETLYIIATVCYILGVEFARKIRAPKYDTDLPDYVDNDLEKDQRSVLFIIIAVSILLCIYMFVAGGGNVFIRSFIDFFTATTNVYSRDRAGFFGVSGMGYIYQFRVVLLPLLSTFLLIGLKRPLPKYISVPLFVVMIIFLLGTGQRNAFVFYCMIVALYAVSLWYYYKIKTFGRVSLIVLGSAAVFFLAILTISNGRVSGDGNQLIGALGSLVDRVFSVNQRTAITAFIYIDSQPTVWGYDWLMMIKDLLPGKSGYMSVDRIVFYIAYGNYNGTGPPDLWGSAWYNFHIFGVTIFPFIMGYIYHRTYLKAITARNKNRFYLLLYCALCIYMGIWCYGTPIMLFNFGVITVLLLRWIIFKLIPGLRDHKIVL